MINKFVMEFGKHATYVSSYKGRKRIVSFTWPVWKRIITEMMHALYTIIPANLKELEQFRDFIVESLNRAIVDTHRHIARYGQDKTEDFPRWIFDYKPQAHLHDERFRWIENAEKILLSRPEKPVFLVSGFEEDIINNYGGIAVSLGRNDDCIDFIEMWEKFRPSAPLIVALSTDPSSLQAATFITELVNAMSHKTAAIHLNWRQYGYEDAVQIARRHTPAEWRQIIADIEDRALFFCREPDDNDTEEEI